jgi:hypothetical protein
MKTKSVAHSQSEWDPILDHGKSSSISIRDALPSNPRRLVKSEMHNEDAD